MVYQTSISGPQSDPKLAGPQPVAIAQAKGALFH